jgi:hypothetical protein
MIQLQVSDDLSVDSQVSDHTLAIELATLLSRLRDSSVEKYQFFYTKDPNCQYTKKALRVFMERDKDKLIAALNSCLARIQL